MANMIEPYIEQILLFFGALIVALFFFKWWKLWQLMKSDRALEKRTEKEGGEVVIEKGRYRNTWDYAFFTGLSKLWHHSDLKTIAALFTMVCILLAYLFTRDNVVLSILGINVGVILGMAIKEDKGK